MARTRPGCSPSTRRRIYLERDGVLELRTVRDPAGLDERRAALGLAPEAENRARLLAAGNPGGRREDEEPASG